jgi:hypothetical protein
MTLSRGRLQANGGVVSLCPASRVGSPAAGKPLPRPLPPSLGEARWSPISHPGDLCAQRRGGPARERAIGGRRSPAALFRFGRVHPPQYSVSMATKIRASAPLFIGPKSSRTGRPTLWPDRGCFCILDSSRPGFRSVCCRRRSARARPTFHELMQERPGLQ